MATVQAAPFAMSRLTLARWPVSAWSRSGGCCGSFALSISDYIGVTPWDGSSAPTNRTVRWAIDPRCRRPSRPDGLIQPSLWMGATTGSAVLGNRARTTIATGTKNGGRLQLATALQHHQAARRVGLQATGTGSNLARYQCAGLRCAPATTWGLATAPDSLIKGGSLRSGWSLGAKGSPISPIIPYNRHRS